MSRARRRRTETAGLDITAFLNLIVVLVPFLLSTAVFSRLSILELNLPAQSSGFNNLKEDIQLEITIRRDALEVSDRMGAFRERIENTSRGYNFATLNELMKALKARFPDKAEVTILAEPDTSYDLVVQTMDAVRGTRSAKGEVTELFPDVSIGDAPLVPTRAETPTPKKTGKT
jgi:biopolymer transport protein ExbD